MNNERFTNDNYWDCNCEDQYIHPKRTEVCPICGAHADGQPDSLTTEIADKDLHFKEAQ